MPSRILRDGILTSLRVNAVSRDAELHYRRLMSIVDDYGRFEADSRVLRAQGWGMREDVSLSEVEAWTAELASGERPLILLYEANKKKYLEIADFNQRVRTDRKGRVTPSRCPSPANINISFEKTELSGNGARQTCDGEAPLHAATRGDTPLHAATRGHLTLPDISGPSKQLIPKETGKTFISDKTETATRGDTPLLAASRACIAGRVELGVDGTGSRAHSEVEPWRADLERFRDAYPKALGNRCAQEFLSLIQSSDDEVLLYRNLPLHRQTWSEDPRYIPSAYRWLNDGLWRIPPKQASQSSGPRYHDLED